MTANEIAQLLEVDGWCKLVIRKEIATMLRQQQAEIEALKQIIDANNLSQNIGQFVKPTNEPVAWTDGKGNYFDKNSFFPVDDLIPLYTHEYERPHNTVLVPCDKLAEMQAEIEALKDKLMLAKQSLEIIEGWTKK